MLWKWSEVVYAGILGYLVCQFLLVIQFIQTSVTKSGFHLDRSQRDAHIFCKFKMSFT